MDYLHLHEFYITMAHSFPDLEFFRIAVVSPELRVADVNFNTELILLALESARERKCSLALFPELSVTGYSCGDLFYNSALLKETSLALEKIAESTKIHQINVVVGAPIESAGKLFNCAVFISNGEILGAIPKTFLPNAGEFYEQRWFSSALNCTTKTVNIGNTKNVPFLANLLFRAKEMPHCVVGIELCEDLWSVIPPSSEMALAGANILLNCSASNELLGKSTYRRKLVMSQSARCLAAYCYAGAGAGESSTDVVYSGHSMIAENGVLLAETTRFEFSTQMAIADIDVERLTNERIRNSSFSQSNTTGKVFQTIEFSLGSSNHEEISAEFFDIVRPISATPFVPANLEKREQNCREIFMLQTTALAKRLRHIGTKTAVIGISGGLDSTLALLVIVKAFEKLDLVPNGIVAVTMPGFGTTERTKNNADLLAKLLGISIRTISIHSAVRQHFADIGHDEKIHDITFENAQARERTQILMDIANQTGGIVVGTGDLSELALGWCTFNADQMAMYNVNAGVPKTLVQYLVEWCADEEFSGDISEVLRDICDTPVSPELLPPDEDGKISQKTEDVVGPYKLHDFFLYYTVRMQFAPRKILFLAVIAFRGEFARTEIEKWMKEFYRRFFGNQFKRSPMPDGPKIGSVGLSPRGDWRMPSDASVALWLKDLEV